MDVWITMMVFPLIPIFLTSLWCLPNTFHYEPQSEFEVKATIILRLIEFVEWPDQDESEVLRIGFLETEAEFRDKVRKVIGKKIIKGRKVQFVTPGDNELGVDLLIIGAGIEKDLSRILTLCEEQSVLMVSSVRGFAKQGSHINLVVRKNKVKFEVNLRTLRATKVSISSQVLRLAEIVDDGKEEEPDE